MARTAHQDSTLAADVRPARSFFSRVTGAGTSTKPTTTAMQAGTAVDAAAAADGHVELDDEREQPVIAAPSHLPTSAAAAEAAAEMGTPNPGAGGSDSRGGDINSRGGDRDSDLSAVGEASEGSRNGEGNLDVSASARQPAGAPIGDDIIISSGSGSSITNGGGGNAEVGLEATQPPPEEVSGAGATATPPSSWGRRCGHGGWGGKSMR